jgi:uncharacterized membrane protein YhaH (DUF805 family)
MSIVPAIWVRLALIAKRWHDLGRSGWWTLISVLPFGGIVQAAILHVAPGTGGVFNPYDLRDLSRVY